MENELDFYGEKRAPDIRMLYDMDHVIFDQDWLESVDNFELYYMYRDLYRNKEEAEAIRSHNLRYDITIIPPAMLGREFVKTAGHYHPHVPGTEYSYTEVYQVLEGEATYLLQKEENGKITDVMVYKVKKGGFVVIPPNYGHMTINASNKTLKMANWVCRDFASIYDEIRDMSGGAYYLLEDGFVPNPSYDSIPEIRFMQSQDDSELGLFDGTDMYDLVNDLDKLKFLTRPQDYLHIFERIIS
jgi:glucose-6-phosphate isomerase